MTAPATTPPHVVGGDISLTASGLAWPDRHVMTYGVVGLANPRLPLGERAHGLEGLCRDLERRICGRGAQFDNALPDLVVVEGLPSARTQVDPERCHLWWAVVFRLALAGVPVLDVPPATVKVYACGMGNANKREVIAGVQEWFPEWEINKTSKTGKVLTTVDDNKADAVALMAIGCELLGEPLVELPAKQRKALDKLELPPGVRRA